MSLLVSVVLSGIALLALPVSRRLTGELFSPASLIVAGWCGALALFLLRLLPYPPLRTDTVAFIAAVLVAMVAGTVIGQVWFERRAGRASRATAPSDTAPSDTAPSGTRSPEAPPLPHADRWVIAFCLIGLAGMVWYVIETSRVLGFETFYEAPRYIRTAIGERRISSRFLFLEYFSIVAPTLAVALALAGVRLSRGTWLLVTLTALSTWFTTDRTHFFVIVLIGYFMALFRQGPALTTRRFLVLSTVSALLLVANFLLVGAWLGKTPRALGLTMDLPTAKIPAVASASSADGVDGSTGGGVDGSAAGSESRGKGRLDTIGGVRRTRPLDGVEVTGVPYSDARAKRVTSDSHWLTQRARRALQSGVTLYLYGTGSFAALDMLLHTERPRTHGMHTFYPFARALERAGVIAGPVPNAIAPFLPLNLTEGPEQLYNVYTFLFYPLEDFGPIGAILYALAIGLLSGVTFAYARHQRSAPDRLLLIGTLQGALLLSIFVNKFNNTASWYILLWSLAPFLITRALRRQRQRTP